MRYKILALAIVVFVFAFVSWFIWMQETNAAPTQGVTITETPCWPLKIVQLDPAFPLPSTCDTAFFTDYPTYIEDYWKRRTEGVTFMYGNNTVQVYGIAVGWDETKVECTTTTKRYQQDYHFGE